MINSFLCPKSFLLTKHYCIGGTVIFFDAKLIISFVVGLLNVGPDYFLLCLTKFLHLFANFTSIFTI